MFKVKNLTENKRMVFGIQKMPLSGVRFRNNQKGSRPWEVTTNFKINISNSYINTKYAWIYVFIIKLYR